MLYFILTISRDEILYQAKIHPEQYSNTFSDEQIRQLHDAMMEVCNTAVDTLAESDKFPKEWLMLHRWSKGKKTVAQLPNGEKITFLKVGGRTSAVVPSIQKKTGAVAGDIAEDADGVEDLQEDVKPKKSNKRKAKVVEDEEDEKKVGPKVPTSANIKRGRKKAEGEETKVVEQEGKPTDKRQKTVKEKAVIGTPRNGSKTEDTNGRRRSGRLSKS